MTSSYLRGVSFRRVTQYAACAALLLLCAAILNAQIVLRDSGQRPGPAGAGRHFPASGRLSKHALAASLDKFKEGDNEGNEVPGKIKTVFVIAMENHNWTQPDNKFTGGIQQIYQNPAAPFINSLVDGSPTVVLDGS